MSNSDRDDAAGNADQIAYWNGAVGERWAGLQERIDTVFAPATAAALAFAAPEPASHVVDIGCGSGATVLAIAEAVGPSGRVLGIDISQPMLRIASERLRSRAVSHADVLLTDAATYAFEPTSFDLAFSRFGVMFFADPRAAFANVRRALADGGRLVFVCWQPLAANAWFDVPLAALRPLCPPAPPTDPDAPGPFAFADPNRVRTLLATAGFEEVMIAPRSVEMPLGSLAEAVDLVSQIGPTSRAIADAEPALRPAMLAALRAALGDHERPDGVVLGGAIWLVSARAPESNRKGG